MATSQRMGRFLHDQLETLNALLDAEADRLCGARKHERHEVCRFERHPLSFARPFFVVTKWSASGVVS
jgi:hypothetical protein